MWRRVAVALELVDRGFEPAEDVRLAVGPDARDRALQVADAAERLRVDHPVGGLVERHHPELVALGQRGRGAQDGLLADIRLAHATDAVPPSPMPPAVLQWQASIERTCR